MANQFVNLPVPASNAAGAAVDVSKMGATKTIVVGGPFQGTVTIEYATDALGTLWAPVPNGSFVGNPGRVTIDLAAHWMRAVMGGFKGGAANVDVGSSGAGSAFIQLGPVAVDVSALPRFKTVVVSGACNVEISEDGVSWSQAFSFQNAGGQSGIVYAQFARVTNGVTAWMGGAEEGDGTGAAPFASTITTIYARTTGSDTSGNGTLANPYRTLQRAVLDVPLSVPPGAQFIIDITGITETLPTDYTLPPWAVAKSIFFDFANPFFFLNAGIMIQATPRLVPLVPASDATIQFADVLSDVQAPDTGLRTITLNVARPSWGVNGLKGKFAIDAANNTRHTVISENTTSSITITGSSAVTFPLQIMEPSAELTGSTNFLSTLNAINIGSIAFNGLKISTPGQFGLYADSCGFAVAQLCELDSPAGTFGPTNFDILAASWIYGTVGLGSRSNFVVTRCLFDAALGAAGIGILQFIVPTIAQISNSVFDACEALSPTSVNGPPASPQYFAFNRCVIKNSPDPIAAMFFSGNRGDFNRLNMFGNAGSGIFMDSGAGCVRLARVITDGPLNGNVGIEVYQGMRVIATATTSGSLTPIRGAAGDMIVGGFAMRTWADFIAAIPPSGHPQFNEFDITSATALGATGSGSQVVDGP